MPVVRIRALPQPPGIDVAAVLAAVTRELAAVLEEEPRGTWATWDELAPGRYSEGGDAPGRQPRDTHPPLVSLVAFEGRSDELVERMLTCVAYTLARALGLEAGNVFVTYEEARAGRIYTGGTVLSARGR
jgi:phenylpyruvate tautomerase PptA (4-oxalocrotonate tautomerase family)